MVQNCLIVLGYLGLNALGQFFGLEALNFCHLHSLSVFIVITSNNKLCLYRQFLSAQAQSLFGNIKRYALDFEKNTTWCNRCHPSCGVSLTFTHTYVCRLASDGFIREDADPHLTLTVHITVDSNTGCLNLTAVDPLRIKGLDTERAESQLCTSVGVAFVATTILRSSISYSFWL